MEKENTLGKRFLNAYNTLDHCLRTQYNFKTNISFSDLIRRAATLNQVIRAYEDDLIDLARLRNAIVHHRNDQIIAEPHKEVVEFMEKVARIISTPPLAIDVIKSVEVNTISSGATLRDYLEYSVKVGHNIIPVYKENTLVGVLQRDNLISAMGQVILAKKSLDEFVNNTSAELFLREFPKNDHFALVSKNIKIEEVLELFGNRKLASIIITSDGTASGKLLGIVTTADILDLMNVIKDY